MTPPSQMLKPSTMPLDNGHADHGDEQEDGHARGDARALHVLTPSSIEGGRFHRPFVPALLPTARRRQRAVAGRRWERAAIGVEALRAGQVVAVLAPADRPRDRQRHDRVGTSSRRSVMPRSPRLRRPARSDRRSPRCAGARTSSDEWARLSSSIARAASTALTWFSPSWRSRMSIARFASLRVALLKCGVRLTSTRVR